MNLRNKTVFLLLALALSACALEKTTPAPVPPSTGSVLPPKYLSVDQFKSCLASQTVGTYSSWCLPAAKPDNCPAASWTQLSNLQGQDKLPRCAETVR